MSGVVTTDYTDLHKEIDNIGAPNLKSKFNLVVFVLVEVATDYPYLHEGVVI
jgi:hypothetical protein